MTPHAALLSMRLRGLRNRLFHLKKDSATKLLVVFFGLANVVLIGLWVSYHSFHFAERFIFGSALNDKLIGLLFFTLLFLVALSTVIISYTTLFLARETAFLMETPVPPRTVLFLKVGEAVSFSAWASLFLCLPVLISFGVLRGAPASYYLEAPLVLATFLVFAGLVGTALSCLFAPVLRRMSGRAIVVAGVALLLALGWVFLRSFEFWALDGENNLLVLNRFMSGLQAMQSTWSPSHWAATAIIASAAGNGGEVGFHLALLLANTLIFLPLLALYGNVRYGREWVARRGAQAGSGGRRRQGRLLDAERWRGPTASLVLKDVLVFLRDPAQVSQSLLFLLLMVIYSLSLVRIPRFVTSHGLALFIYFANIAAVSMILSSFTSRFLFPLLSLEGRAFWVLGLAPMRRGVLLRQKVVFGLALSTTLGMLTIVVSNLSLRTPPDLFLTAVWSLLLAATGLTCLATGLGAAYPSFDEDNPSRIAAGLGGTLNFFASALFVLVLVALEALPYIVSEGLRPTFLAEAGAHLASLLFTAVVSLSVLSLGGRALARSEF